MVTYHNILNSNILKYPKIWYYNFFLISKTHENSSHSTIIVSFLRFRYRLFTITHHTLPGNSNSATSFLAVFAVKKQIITDVSFDVSFEIIYLWRPYFQENKK